MDQSTEERDVEPQPTDGTRFSCFNRHVVILSPTANPHKQRRGAVIFLDTDKGYYLIMAMSRRIVCTAISGPNRGRGQVIMTNLVVPPYSMHCRHNLLCVGGERVGMVQRYEVQDDGTVQFADVGTIPHEAEHCVNSVEIFAILGNIRILICMQSGIIQMMNYDPSTTPSITTAEVIGFPASANYSSVHEQGRKLFVVTDSLFAYRFDISVDGVLTNRKEVATYASFHADNAAFFYAYCQWSETGDYACATTDSGRAVSIWKDVQGELIYHWQVSLDRDPYTIATKGDVFYVLGKYQVISLDAYHKQRGEETLIPPRKYISTGLCVSCDGHIMCYSKIQKGVGDGGELHILELNEVRRPPLFDALCTKFTKLAGDVRTMAVPSAVIRGCDDSLLKKERIDSVFNVSRLAPPAGDQPPPTV